MTSLDESKAKHPSNYGRAVGRADAGPPLAPPGRHLIAVPDLDDYRQAMGRAIETLTTEAGMPPGFLVPIETTATETYIPETGPPALDG